MAMLSDQEIDAIGASQRRRKRIVTALAALIPVCLFGFLGRDCYRQHQRNARYEEARHTAVKESQRKTALAAAKDLERRRRLFADPKARAELDLLLAGTAQKRETAALDFAEGITGELPEGRQCTSLSKKALAASVKKHRMAMLSGSDKSERMMAELNAQAQSGLMGNEIRSIAIPVTWKRKGQALESTLLASNAMAEQVARDQLAQGLFPQSMSWGHNQGFEIVLIFERYKKPYVSHSANALSAVIFKAGVAEGQAILWSHSQKRVVCAAEFAARSSEQLETIQSRRYTTEIGPGAEAESKARFLIALDFEDNLVTSIASALRLP